MVFAFSLSAQICLAQKINIKWSEPIEHSKIFYVHNFADPDGNTFYTYYYENKSEKYKLRYYDKDLKVQKEQDLLYGLPGYSFSSFSCTGINGIYHLMIENVKRTEEGKLIFIKNESAIGSNENQNEKAPFEAPEWIKTLHNSVSKNDSYIMYSTLNYNKKDKTNIQEYEIFNTTEGDTKQKGSLNVPALKDKVESYCADNYGNAYFLVKRGIGFRPKDREEKPTIELLVFHKNVARKNIAINNGYYAAPAIDLISDDSGIFITGLIYFTQAKEKNKADESVFMYNYFDSKKWSCPN